MLNSRIGFFLPTVGGGGAERVTLNLAGGLAKAGFHVELILATAEGSFLKQVPEGIAIVDLQVERMRSALFPLAQHLYRNEIDLLFPQMTHSNIVALMAKFISQSKTIVCPVEHTTLSLFLNPAKIRDRILIILMQCLYPFAGRVISVSSGVGTDLENLLKFKSGHVTTIYNPVVDQSLLTKSKEPICHPWFAPGAQPVFLGVGRLTSAKDFATLIKAFSLFRKQHSGKLLILGDGPERQALLDLITQLELEADVSLPGFVDNPYPYLASANAFILSSTREGLPTVLIEALACGCPVISTDCPSGPREILANGRFGRLVPVEDPESLSRAMADVVIDKPNYSDLIKRSENYSIEQAVSNYSQLIEALVGHQ